MPHMFRMGLPPQLGRLQLLADPVFEFTYVTHSEISAAIPTGRPRRFVEFDA